MPSTITRPPERLVHTCGSMRIKIVEAFNSIVNTTNDATRLAVMIYGRHTCFSPDPDTLPPKITGNKGRMHGANAVSTPATNINNVVSITPKPEFLLRDHRSLLPTIVLLHYHLCRLEQMYTVGSRRIFVEAR